MPSHGSFARALTIAAVGALTLARYVLLRARLALFEGGELVREAGWGGASGVHAASDPVGHLRGRLLREACETLGATFIKLGQVMSTRLDLFGPAFVEELCALQDRIPAFEGAPAIVREALGPAFDAQFTRSSIPTPVAAASVAQVHRGVLRDGSEVAVKVLRPDVRARAEGDGEILRLFARLAEGVSEGARHAELARHLDHFLEGVLAQTDLRLEAANYERFRRNFRRNKQIRFPKVYPALSTERVLTMEFVRGDKIDRIDPSRFPDLPRVLREAFLQMSFDDGFLHADLHPGNFVVQEDGKVVIFDVGLTKSLSDGLLEHYIDFNRCLAMGEVDDFMAHLRRFHSYVEGTVDWAELEVDVRRFHEEFRSRSARELEFRQLIDSIFATGRKHGVRPVPEMALMMVGLVTAEGIGKRLDPNVNSFQEVSNYLLPVLARRNMLTPRLMEAARVMNERFLADHADPLAPEA